MHKICRKCSSRSVVNHLNVSQSLWQIPAPHPSLREQPLVSTTVGVVSAILGTMSYFALHKDPSLPEQQ